MVVQPNSYLQGRDQFEVIAAACVVRRLGALEGYYYHGMRLPADASPAEIERLLDLGMIRRVPTEGDEP